MWSDRQGDITENDGKSKDDHFVEDSNSNPSILAPRPWRSFSVTEMQSSAMVVRKRRAPQPPIEKIEIKDAYNNALKIETDIERHENVFDKKRPPTPPFRTVSLKSPGQETKEQFENSNWAENLDEPADLDNNCVFTPEFSDQSVNQILSYETTSPSFFETFKSNVELEIAVDGNVIDVGKVECRDNIAGNDKKLSSYEVLYDSDNRCVTTNQEEIVNSKEEEVITENQTLNISDNGTKTANNTTETVRTVVMRTTTKKLDLTIRTSQIENLDESEILKEFSADGEIVNSISHLKNEKYPEFEDEADFVENSEKRKSEILLKVEELGDSINEMINNSFPVSTSQPSNKGLSSPRKYSPNNSNNSPIVGKKLSIAGWADFAKGKGLVR